MGVGGWIRFPPLQATGFEDPATIPVKRPASSKLFSLRLFFWRIFSFT
jgi:hypothetical protein